MIVSISVYVLPMHELMLCTVQEQARLVFLSKIDCLQVTTHLVLLILDTLDKHYDSL